MRRRQLPSPGNAFVPLQGVGSCMQWHATLVEGYGYDLAFAATRSCAVSRQDFDERDSIRAAAALNPKWKEFLELSRPHVQFQVCMNDRLRKPQFMHRFPSCTVLCLISGRSIMVR